VSPKERALVMGLGSFGGGEGAVRHLCARGFEVTVTDLRPAATLRAEMEQLGDLELAWVLGEHRAEDFERTDLLCVNPAVAPDHPLLVRARSKGTRITSEIELFLESVHARLYCISGTQGKSSTAHLLAQLLEGTGFSVHLGGNIGGSLLPELDRIKPEDICVLELSSYQLEALSDHLSGSTLRRIEAVCLTNVLADHLERHGSLEAYALAKQRILQLGDEDSFALVPADDRRVSAWPTRGQRIRFADRPLSPSADSDQGQALFLSAGAFRWNDEVLGFTKDLSLPGRFQQLNALCALGMARLAGATPGDLQQAVSSLRGLPYRMEELGFHRGRRIIDNSVSTTPDSTCAALRELSSGTCLMVGGRRKELAFDELANLAAAKEVVCVAFGEARESLARDFAKRGCRTFTGASVEDAVELAFEHTPPEGCILFSPACASFDAFPNFRARAEAFRNALPEASS